MNITPEPRDEPYCSSPRRCLTVTGGAYVRMQVVFAKCPFVHAAKGFLFSRIGTHLYLFQNMSASYFKLDQRLNLSNPVFNRASLLSGITSISRRRQFT